MFQKTKNFKKQNGFSLIEIVVYIAVLSVVFLIIVSLFIAHSRLYSAGTILKNIQTENLLALDTMSREIRQAVEFTASKTIDGAPYTSSAETLIIKLPSLDAAKNIIAGKYDYAVFYLNSINTNKLYSNTETDPSSSRPSGQKLLSEFVNKLIFRYNNSSISESNLVDIYLKTAKEARGQTHEFTNSTSVKLRNK